MRVCAGVDDDAVNLLEIRLLNTVDEVALMVRLVERNVYASFLRVALYFFAQRFICFGTVIIGYRKREALSIYYGTEIMLNLCKS